MRRHMSILFLGFLLFTHVADAENWAAVVGIDRYSKIGPNLNFCEADAKLFQESLIKYAGFKPEHIRTLFNEEATKANIQNLVLGWLKTKAQPGDRVVFYFSGHGVQIPDGSGDEPDGKDESLVAHDSWLVDTRFILDDELGRWLEQIDTTNKTVILDCCYSGTGIRSLDFDTQIREYYPPEPIQITDTRSLNPARDMSDAQSPGALLMSACDSNQVAMESRTLGHGVFTYYLSQSLSGKADTDGDGRLSVQEVAAYTVNRIKSDGWEQDPQLEGDTDGKFLVGEEEITDPYGTVTAIESGEIFNLALGAKEGVTVGSLYAVFSPNADTTEGVGKGLLEIQRVGKTRSIAAPFQLKDSVEVGDKVVEYRHKPSFGNLRIRLAPVEEDRNLPRTWRQVLQHKLDAYLTAMSHVELVRQPEAAAERRLEVMLSRGEGPSEYHLNAQLLDIRSQKKGQEYTLTFDWQQIDKAIETLLSDEYIGGEIEGAYVLKRLSQLTNPANPPVKLTLELNKGANAIYEIGDVLELSATTDRDCYLTLLDIGSSGKVTVFFPNQWQKDNRVRAGETVHVPAPMSSYMIQVGGPPGTETIKAIATLDPLDLEELSMDDLQQQFKFFDTPASGALSEKLTGKDLFLVETDRWAEASIHFRVAPDKLYDSRAVLELSIYE